MMVFAQIGPYPGLGLTIGSVV